MKKLAAALFLASVVALGGPAASAQTRPVAADPVLMMVHVRVADMQRSERFYRDVFGMEVTRIVSERERVLRFPNASATAPGVILLLAREGSPPNGGFLVQAPNIDAVFARVAAAGGQIERAPRETVPGVKAGFITDPDGAHIEVMQFTE